MSPANHKCLSSRHNRQYVNAFTEQIRKREREGERERERERERESTSTHLKNKEFKKMRERNRGWGKWAENISINHVSWIICRKQYYNRRHTSSFRWNISDRVEESFHMLGIWHSISFCDRSKWDKDSQRSSIPIQLQYKHWAFILWWLTGMDLHMRV